VKIPKFLFAFLNPIVIAWLNSPLHGLFSSSVLVLYFRGRRSGRALRTPVRYLQKDAALLILTNGDAGWWPNFRAPAAVEVQLRGQRRKGEAIAVTAPDPQVRTAISEMLATHPADAAYLNIAKDSGPDAIDGQWDAASFAAAVDDTVIVTIALEVSGA
jgi:deazaflavin-dependent oxidoreductase (nitroreductase family)